MRRVSNRQEIDQTKRNQKFCSQCGNEFSEYANFCSNCGNPKNSSGSEKISSAYKCPACGNILPSLQISSGGWICPLCNAKIDRNLNILSDPKEGSSQKVLPSYNSGKSIDFIYLMKISGGLLVLLIVTIITATVAKSAYKFLYDMIFLILLGGILFEGWEAVKQ